MYTDWKIFSTQFLSPIKWALQKKIKWSLDALELLVYFYQSRKYTCTLCDIYFINNRIGDTFFGRSQTHTILEQSKRQRKGRGERRKMVKNTMKWLRRLILPKSTHTLILWGEGEREFTLCLLFAQQPHPAGKHLQEKRGDRVVWVACDERMV